MVPDTLKLFRKLMLYADGANLLPSKLGARASGSVYTFEADEGVTPAGGVYVTIGRRGGATHNEIPLENSSVMVRFWAGAFEWQKARDAHRAMKDWCHGKTMFSLGADGFVLTCLEQVPPQEVKDPDTGWATVIAFYEIQARE